MSIIFALNDICQNRYRGGDGKYIDALMEVDESIFTNEDRTDAGEWLDEKKESAAAGWAWTHKKPGSIDVLHFCRPMSAINGTNVQALERLAEAKRRAAAALELADEGLGEAKKSLVAKRNIEIVTADVFSENYPSWTDVE